MERFSISSLDSELVQIEAWPIPDLARFDAAQVAFYKNHRRAIEMILQGQTDTLIRAECGISRQTAVYWLKRCLELHSDGKIYGFRALKSYLRIGPYTRTADIPEGPHYSASGLAGAFGRLLRDHPELKVLLDRHILKLENGKYIYESRVRLQSLHRRFLAKCRELNLDVGQQYPFNTATLGHRSLSNYVRKSIRQNIVKATAANFGRAAAKTLATGDGSKRPVFRPFERVECDAHKIDGRFAILIPSPFGEPIVKIVNRLWVLTIQDVASTAVLMHFRSPHEEINSDDVLELASRTTRPWQPRSLRIPTLKYRKGAGYPSSLDPRLIGACWREFSVDGGLAEVCKRVQTQLKAVFGAQTVTLPRRNPNDRPYVESFFGILEENGFHRLPNTTGRNPADSRRSQPEHAAIKYEMQVEHLDELLDVMHANYNATPKGTLGGRTPLEYLKYLCEAFDCWPQQADSREVDKLLVISRVVPVRGSISQGRAPHVNFASTRYTSDILKRASDLIGKKIRIEISRDIRTVHAYSMVGADLGPLAAAPPWNRSPHTWEIRRAVMAHIRNKTLQYEPGDDPIIDYLTYLEDCARGNKPVSPHYLELRSMLTEEWSAAERSSSIIDAAGGEDANSTVQSKAVADTDGREAEGNGTIPQRLFRKVING